MTQTLSLVIQSHVEKSETEYKNLRPLYTSFAKEVEKIITESLKLNLTIRVHEIQSRGKTIDSFCKKVSKPHEDSKSEPKYLSPFDFDYKRAITDLAGVRVIVFFPRNLIPLEKFIQDEFQVVERKDIGEERFLAGTFGYSSIHFLVKLKETHAEMDNYESFKERFCEIQIRTILQHAWAEMEHDIQYKSEILHPDIKRRFLELAGVINVADREFQTIFDLHENYQTLKNEVKDDLSDTNDDVFSEENEVTSEINTSQINLEKKTIGKKTPRQLVELGEYQAAIDEYTSRINQSPFDNLLYAGRSKARFLFGDNVGAIRDIEEAIRRVPTDYRLQKLKQQYEEGNLTASSKSVYEIVNDGHDMLRKGNAEEAFGKYVIAGEKGYDQKLISFNKSMATILKKDSDGASYFLDDLLIFSGSPMECSILGLRAIISAINKKGFSQNLMTLKKRILGNEIFEFNQSPLKHLEIGFRNRDGEILGNLSKVFDSLKRIN